MTLRRAGTLLAVLAMAAAACGTSDDATDAEDTETADPTTTTTAETAAITTTTTEAPAPSTQVGVAESGLGSILVDSDGKTLYLFTPDNQGDSACYDGCAEAWPPLTGDFTAGDGVDGALLGTAPRTDGPDQVTYNGWPLYYFANDGTPGDTNGQGINDVWYVLDTNGDGIGLAATGPTLTVADSDLGSVLVDGDGNTLYLFIPDNQGDSACYDGCAEAWPPLTGDFTAGDGVDGALLGTAPRTDGPDQVTYNGWPLYYFANDGTPGDTNGQGINDVWYVLDANGDGIGAGG